VNVHIEISERDCVTFAICCKNSLGNFF